MYRDTFMYIYFLNMFFPSKFYWTFKRSSQLFLVSRNQERENMPQFIIRDQFNPKTKPENYVNLCERVPSVEWNTEESHRMKGLSGNKLNTDAEDEGLPDWKVCDYEPVQSVKE